MQKIIWDRVTAKHDGMFRKIQKVILRVNSSDQKEILDEEGISFFLSFIGKVDLLS